MPQHMVIFQNPDGDTGYNQFEDIDEAVKFVEKLRNDQGIDNIRIFELAEVKFDLKPYYKVELQALTAGSPTSSSAAGPATSGAGAPSSGQSTPPPPRAEPAPAETSATSSSPFAPPSEQKPSYQSPAPGPVPPADQPGDDAQPTRRGLFGR